MFVLNSTFLLVDLITKHYGLNNKHIFCTLVYFGEKIVVETEYTKTCNILKFQKVPIIK